MNWVGQVYLVIGSLWGICWSVAAAIEWCDWADDRDKNYRKDEAKDHRQKFLSSLAMVTLSPAWPVPVVMFIGHGVQAMYRETRRAIKEEVTEAIETANTKRDT